MAVKNWCKIGEGVIGFSPLMKDFLLFWPPTSMQNSIKMEQKLRPYERGQTDRQTDRRTQVLVGAFARGPAYSWVPAGYTVNTYSKPPLYYTLGAVAPLLPCAAVHTHSGLTALCADRLTRDGHDLSTSQPDNQQPFCQYPAVSWEICPISNGTETYGTCLLWLSIARMPLNQFIVCHCFSSKTNLTLNRS